FYLPAATTVQRLTVWQDDKPGSGALDSITSAHDKTVVSAFFRLPRGHRVKLMLDYENRVALDRIYQLYLQKQAGIPGLPTQVTISYPGGVKSWRTDLSHDQAYSLRW
ncbi:MAG: hypothetical protein M3082_06275, partial [Candidatus Dormibacteraeota bacterium]|nr:hypothetical protein [Candidatus Dormibacteraeota bacterium]